ncbi:MAG TPA: RtcB family protein, partial [Phnomibacter sp.]|nr:RtcB family protein [Phnomibacter sp.]
MQKLSIRGKDLRLIGFPEGPVMSLAITTMQQHYKYYSVQQALSMLQEVLKNPTDFLQHQHLGKIAKGLLP